MLSTFLYDDVLTLSHFPEIKPVVTKQAAKSVSMEDIDFVVLAKKEPGAGGGLLGHGGTSPDGACLRRLEYGL